MKSNFSDLRFIDDDNITLLNYWIKNYTDSVGAWVYVNIPLINASSTKIINMYYGNSGAVTTSDWGNTFAKYEDHLVGNATWPPRSYFGTAVFNNKIWIFGGMNNSWENTNDVWYSSDGKDWTEATSNATWPPRD